MLVVVYCFMVVFGLLVKFGFGLASKKHFYMGSETVEIWKAAIYHALNFLIFVPVTLLAMYKLYIVMAGSLA